MDVFNLNDYIKLLLYYKKNNFEVINLTNFIEKYSNKSIPDKIVLLRHDIHLRDIENAYKMIEIENNIFNNNVATYFVQWNFIGSTDYEEKYEKYNNKKYEEFIFFCIKNKIDVLPHLSLYCNTFKNLYNRNNKNINFLDNLIEFKLDTNKINNQSDINKQDFLISKYSINNCCNFNVCCNTDCKNLIKNDLCIFINDIKLYLKKYKDNWYKKFNFYPKYYSNHGDGMELTKKINPNFFAAISDLEKDMINVNSINIFLGNISKYKLYYKSDNSCNIDIINKDLFNDKNKFQLLIHPYVWSK